MRSDQSTHANASLPPKKTAVASRIQGSVLKLGDFAAGDVVVVLSAVKRWDELTQTSHAWPTFNPSA